MELQEIKFQNKKFRVYLRGQADKSIQAEIFKIQEYRCAENIIKTAQFPVIDAGAQAGFFVLYCRALNAKIKIYALEPEPENAQILAKHLKLNHIRDVKIFQQALAEKKGKKDFYVTADTHDHSLIKPEQFKTQISVATVSLADFLQEHKINRVSLLKMDIEGAEFETLEKLNEGDWQKIGNILLEYHDRPGQRHQQLADLIRQHGFSLELFPSHYDSKLGFIFARNKRVK